MAQAYADPEPGIAFGCVTDGFLTGVTADPRVQALVRAVRTSLQRLGTSVRPH